jgi:hypothetical protein
MFYFYPIIFFFLVKRISNIFHSPIFW